MMSCSVMMRTLHVRRSVSKSVDLSVSRPVGGWVSESVSE
jgi:hypothetical protein